MYRNLPVRLRSALGFVFALALILVVVAISISSLKTVNSNFEVFAKDILSEVKTVSADAGEHVSELINETVADNQNSINDYTKTIIILLVALIAVGYLIARVTALSITKPLKAIAATVKEMSMGNLSAKLEFESKDELGDLANDVRSSLDILSGYISEIDRVMQEMSRGNFNCDFEKSFVGNFENIEVSIKAYSEKMSLALRQMGSAAEQVSAGSIQVSNGAQSLSKGTMEQAASVEELSATITTIADSSKENAENAKKASEEVGQVGIELSDSQQKMNEMISAMQNISDTSNEIGKIIKTIEDIAFQTNILALNAAVEAARAGAAGQGFAVVADEVRNLASKSAEASKNSTALIEHSIIAVKNGSAIVDETASVLNGVVEGAQNIIENINKISNASDMQSDSVEQIRIGMDQISNVVQTNSATSQQSAASSQELSGQAQLMKQLLEQFKL